MNYFIQLAIVILVGSLLLFLSILPAPELKPFSTGEIFQTPYMRGSGKNQNNFAHWIPIKEVNPSLICSVIKAEDRQFFNHHGFDLAAIFRATFKGVRTGDFVGASTISQQLAKNLLGNHKRNLYNKLLEAWVTLKLEFHLSKQDILELYLNSIEMARDRYGIKNAANLYFNKEPIDLKPEESIFLASLIASPRTITASNSLARIDKTYHRINYQLLRSELFATSDYDLINKNWPEMKASLLEAKTDPRIKTLRTHQIKFRSNPFSDYCGIDKELLHE